jgi:multiple sugar transport system substrate-binding protein
MKHRSSFANTLMAMAMIGSIALAANVNSGAAPARAAGTVSLATWSSNPTEQAGQKKLVASFEAKYGIHVDFQVINGDYPTILKTRFVAGTAPDVFYIGSDQIQDFASTGSLLNLDFLKKDKTFAYSKYYKNLQSSWVYHGHVYAVTKDYSTLGLFYNKDKFKAAGIKKLPTTWAQLKSDACKLTNKANKVYGLSLSADPARWLAFLLAAGGGTTGGGGILNKAQTKSSIAGKAGVTSLSFYAGLVKSGCAATPSQVGAGWNGEAFGHENAAMTIEGVWMLSYLQQTFPNVHWGIAPLPKGPTGKQGNLAFVGSYGAYARSSNKANQRKLIEYLAGKTGASIWSHVVSYIPGRKDVKLPPGTKVFVQQVKYARTFTFPPGFGDRALTPMGNDIQAVMDGKMSAKQAIADMQQKATAALSQAP